MMSTNKILISFTLCPCKGKRSLFQVKMNYICKQTTEEFKRNAYAVCLITSFGIRGGLGLTLNFKRGTTLKYVPDRHVRQETKELPFFAEK